MSTRFKHTVRILFVLVLLLGLGVAWMLTTNIGLRLLLRAADSMSAGAVTVQSATGSLSEGAQLNGISIKSPAGAMRIDRLSLRCECRLLMLGILELDRASASGVAVNLSGKSSAGGSTGHAPWVVALLIDDLELNDIAVQLPGRSAPLEITHLSTRLLARRGHLAVSDLHLTRPRLQVWYNGRISLKAPFQLESRAGWTAVLQDRIPLSGSARLHGDEDRLQANVTLQGPLEVQLSADLREPLGARNWTMSLRSQWTDLRRLAPKLSTPLFTRMDLEGAGEGISGRVHGRIGLSQSAGKAAGHALQLIVDVALAGKSAKRHLKGTLAWKRFKWLFGDSTLASNGGALRLDGPLSAPVLTGSNRFSVNGAPGTLALNAVLGRKALDLRTATLTSGAASLTAAGGIKLIPGGPAADLRMHWRNLSASAPWLGDINSSQGSATLHGRPGAWTLASTGDLGGKRVPAGQFNIKGSGSQEKLTLDSWQLLTLNGAVDGSGRIVLSGRPAFTLQFSGHNLDPGVRWPGWSGDLTTTGHARWVPGQQMQVQMSVDGRLRDRPATLGLDLGASPDHLSIHQFKLRSGSASAEIHGTAGAALNLAWQVDVPNLSAVHPHMSGRLAGEGRIQGPQGKPEVRGRLSAAGIRSPWLDLNELRAQADLDLAIGRKLQATVSMAGLRYRGSPPASLDLHLHGDAASQELQLDASRGKTRLSLSASGSLQGDAWQGTIRSVRVAASDQRSWSLANPTDLAFTAGQVSLSRLCLQGQDGQWCAQGTWTPAAGAWTIRGSASALPLKWLRWRLPSTISLKGTARLDAAAAGTGAQLDSARGDIALNNAALLFDTGAAQPYRLPVTTGTGSMRLQGDELHAAGKLDFARADVKPFTADLTLSGIRSLPLKPSTVRINGAVSAGADDLSFLSTAFAYATDLHGGFQADMKVSGTLAAPRLGGNFSIRNCSFDVPDLGTHVEDLELKGTGAGAGRYHVSGKLRSGQGSLTISGKLDPANDRNSHLKINGKQFELVNLPELWALVSPHLDISWSAKGPMVSGHVVVPKAKVDLDEAVVKTPISDDVVVMGQKKRAEPSASPLPGTDVQLVLGDQVKVSGRGVSGKLSGQLHLTSRPGTKLLADGEINISDGTYSAYGQSLKIQEGHLLYRHTQLDNPSLRVRAVRTVQDVSAGVSVSGYLTQPDISLFSSPSMSQEETLSYIVFGRPLNNLSSGNGTDLMAAAASLGLQNSGMVTSSLASTFGLNKVQVQTGATTDSTSLLIGKYLTPRLYLSYGVGLFQTVAAGKLRYDFGKHWAIEAERSNAFGVDLLYKIEK